MAITVGGVGTHFFGLSSDPKPTGVYIDSTFLETDTGAIFTYDGVTWDMIQAGGTVQVVSHTQLWNGSAWEDSKTAAKWYDVSIVAGTAEVVMATPAAGKKLRILGWDLFIGAATVLTFRLTTGLAGTVERTLHGGSGTNGVDRLSNVSNGLISAVANNVLTIQPTASAAVNGRVWGLEE